MPSTHYPLYDFDLRATHARTLLPAALASVSFSVIWVCISVVRVRVQKAISFESANSNALSQVICGQPIGREHNTQALNRHCRGAWLMSMAKSK